MKYIRQKVWFAVFLLLLLVMAGCSQPAVEIEEAATMELQADENHIGTSEELIAFFHSGGEKAILNGNITLGDQMLTLTKERGSVSIEGNGYSILSSAACVVRLEDDAVLELNDVALVGEKRGLGFLGDGTVCGNGSVQGREAALYAAGGVTIGQYSDFQFTAEEGAGILCEGLILEEGAKVNSTGVWYGVSAQHETVKLEADAQLICSGMGDNAFKVDGDLMMAEGSLLETTNLGAHNGAKIGTLEADLKATLVAKGGSSGIGLFVVEQHEDVVLRGSCEPEVRVEVGKGRITFVEE